MRCPIMRALLVLITLIAVNPMLASAQTPVVATPEPGLDLQAMILVESGGDLMTLNETGTPVPSELDHRLARITMQPGFGFHTGPVMTSAVIYVESGSVSVETAYVAAQVTVGEGEPVVSASDDSVVCGQGICDVQPGEPVVLGAGNGFALAGDTVEIHAVGDGPAVIELSAVMSAGNPPLCWICPTA